MAGSPQRRRPPARARLKGAGPPKGREFGGGGVWAPVGGGPRPRPGLRGRSSRPGAEEPAGSPREPRVVRWGLQGRREVPGVTVPGPQTGPLWRL